MTAAYWTAKEEAEFEKAFEKFNLKPTAQRTFEPTPKDKIPLPWYLDPNSGGPPDKNS
jgi:hypothetical protein